MLDKDQMKCKAHAGWGDARKSSEYLTVSEAAVTADAGKP
jgi:hypothetical protein